MRVVTTTAGLGELCDDDTVRLLKSEYPDMGIALDAGESVASICARGTRLVEPLEAVTLLPPVVAPSKIWAQGIGYRSHAQERGFTPPAAPRVFLVAPSALIGSGAPIVLPEMAPNEVDYEGEIAVVIGRRCSKVAEKQAWEYLAGITGCNDVSARDVQRGNIGAVSSVALASRSLAKSFDTFKPVGPALAEIRDASDLRDISLTTVVDGEVRQRGSTSDLIFTIGELISFLSWHSTLLPGDIVATGTPAGVGVTQGRFLRAGSTVVVVVSGVGKLVNPVEGPVATPGSSEV